MKVREPVAAGRYYPGSPGKLREMVAAFTAEGAVPKEAWGAYSPHAGYPYSGQVAGATLSRIKLPDTAIVLGPNHSGLGRPLSIMTRGAWRTPLGDTAIDEDLAASLLDASAYLEEDAAAHQYEHSVEVQLPFLQYLKPDIKIVPVVVGYESRDIVTAFGREIAAVLKETGREAVIIASGDMTHHEPEASARRKDNQAIEAILDLDAETLLERVARLDISMCGHATAACLIAAVRELGDARPELVEYTTSGPATGDYRSVVGYAGIIIKKAEPLTALARRAVEAYVRRGETVKPKDIIKAMREQAGVFVSIHQRGELRGCIGTISPSQPNIAAEIVANARSAATRDPRFEAVTPEELDSLDYKVDVLGNPEPVSGEDELDPRKYGVIVTSGYRRGLLLPDLEGVDTVAEQIDICRMKAGIGPDEPVALERFEVIRYEE